MKEKVLILNQIFWPDKINTARHISELAEELAERGLEVTVFVGNRDYRSDKIFKSKEFWKGINITRVHIPILFGRGWFQRIFTSFWLICAFSFKLITDRNYKFLIIGSNPPFIFLILPILRILFRKSKLFVWVFDLYPDAIYASINMEIMILKKVTNRILKYCYSKADVIIDIGPCMRRKILKYSPDIATFHTLTPWSFVEFRNFEDPHIETRKTLFKDSTLAILYTGTIGNAHEFDTFLSLARKLRELNASVGFCFAGFGSRYDELKSKVLIDDTNVTIAGFVNSDLELEQRVSAADLMMVSLRPEWTGISVPSKFFTSIATAKPVLFSGSQDSAISHWIQEYGLGFQVSTMNIDEIAYKLRDISLDQKLIANLKERATKAYGERFSKKVVCDEWYNILSNCR